MDSSKNHDIRKCFRFKALAICFAIIIICTCTARLYNIKIFEDYCKVYIDRVSKTADVNVAREELNQAIDYIEKKGLTFGTISIAFNSPKNNLDFWYNSLKSIYKDLDNFPVDATITEKSIFMMMVHETINNLSFPSGIDIYPYNLLYFWILTISLIGFVVFIVLFYKTKKRITSKYDS